MNKNVSEYAILDLSSCENMPLLIRQMLLSICLEELVEAYYKDIKLQMAQEKHHQLAALLWEQHIYESKKETNQNKTSIFRLARL